MSDVISDKIVLFDGVCNFCNSSVQFIIRHDKSNALKFASLQSNTGQELIAKYNISKDVDSVIFIENGNAFTKSEAALRIADNFGGVWKMMRILKVIPAFISNLFYDIIARNRYKWFGKKETCMIPSPEIRNRFMDV